MSESSEQHLQKAVEALTGSIQELRQELVRKDVYQSDQRGIDSRFHAIEVGIAGVAAQQEKQEERRAADRRLILAAFVAPFLLGILMLYITAQVGGPA